MDWLICYNMNNILYLYGVICTLEFRYFWLISRSSRFVFIFMNTWKCNEETAPHRPLHCQFALPKVYWCKYCYFSLIHHDKTLSLLKITFNLVLFWIKLSNTRWNVSHLQMLLLLQMCRYISTRVFILTDELSTLHWVLLTLTWKGAWLKIINNNKASSC